jgi:hypothetical protein
MASGRAAASAAAQRRLANFAVLAAALLALRCAQPASSDESDLDALPRLTITVLTRIGDVDNPDVGLSRPYGLDVDRDGLLYVFEGADMQIRVYNPDGTVVRRIGGRGEGPGEFEDGPRFGVVGDTVWAYDMFASRITLFRRDGTLLSASGRADLVRIPLPRGYGYVTPWMMRPDGRFTSDFTRVAFSRNDPPTGVQEGDSIPVPRVVFDATGAVLDTIGWDASPPPRMVAPPGAPTSRFEMIEFGGRRLLVPDAPPPLGYWIPLHDGRLMIDTPLSTDEVGGIITITRLTLERDTVFSRSYHYRPERWTEAELDAEAERASRGFGSMEAMSGGSQPPADPAAKRVLREAMTYPEFKLPLESATLDEDGRVWLARDVAGDSPRRWIIVDHEGRPLGEVELPPRTRFLWSSGDVFWTVEPDEFDVPWLVHYRMNSAR